MPPFRDHAGLSFGEARKRLADAMDEAIAALPAPQTSASASAHAHDSRLEMGTATAVCPRRSAILKFGLE